MDSQDLKVLEGLAGETLDGYIKSLYEMSASNELPAKYCLTQKCAGKRTAVWFDRIMERSDWGDVSNRIANNDRCPHRIDSLYLKGGEFYLIEFKCDSDVAKFADEYCFKFYESFIQLLKHKWLDIDESNNHLTYIIVYRGKLVTTERDIRRNFLATKNTRERDALKLDLTSPYLHEYLIKPWKHIEKIRPKGGLDILELMGCKAVMTLTQTQFDTFVQEKGWV